MFTALIRRPLTIVVALALLLALSGSATPPSAQASDTLTLRLMFCDSGLNQFYCGVTVRGGTAPYSYTWQAISNAVITSNIHDSGADGSCTSGQLFTIEVTVQDSLGATATKNTSTLCRSGPWQ